MSSTSTYISPSPIGDVVVLARPFADVPGVTIRWNLPDEGKRDVDVLRHTNAGELPLSSAAMLGLITLPCGRKFLEKWGEWVI